MAADFQRVQASSTAHRLSERNCVELVNKLVELRLVDVVYTVDGKEYVTPQQLEREIRDELAVNRGGRRNRTHVRTTRSRGCSSSDGVGRLGTRPTYYL